MSKPQNALSPRHPHSGGRRRQPTWGKDIQGDLDRITKWDGDVRRMMDRLTDLQDALWALDYNMRRDEETRDLLEGALTISTQVFGKAGMIFRAIYRAHGRMTPLPEVI